MVGATLIKFQEPQQALSPGQSLVLYQGDRVLGGGIIQPFKRHQVSTAGNGEIDAAGVAAGADGLRDNGEI